MARPSVSVPDELLEDFDEAIWQRKLVGDLDRDANRSTVMRELMQEFVEETEGFEGNSKAAAATAD